MIILSQPTYDRNHKTFDVLYEILIDNYEDFENKMKELILIPDQIPDT